VAPQPVHVRRHSYPGSLLLVSLLLGISVAGCCREPGKPDRAQCGDSTAFRILASAPPEVPVLVLYDGWQNDTCRTDLVCVGHPDVALGDVRWGLCGVTELVAFAPGFAPSVLTDCPHRSDGTQCDGAEPLKMESPVEVSVAVWVVAPGDSLDEETTVASHELEHANGAFQRSGAGIVLTYDVTGVSAQDKAKVDAIGNGCGQAAAMREHTDVYHRGAINVYYVKTLDHVTLDIGGSCWPNRDVVYAARDAKRPALLAHEIGHSLGLVTPDLKDGHIDQLPEYGDSAGRPEFRDNLMNSRVETVENVWLGQIYRIHFDTLSWFYSPVPSDRRWRECQDSASSASPCPPLTLRPQGWP